MTERICPKCNSKLKEHSTYKVTSKYNTRNIGKHLFCTNKDCNYEVDLYNDGTVRV